MSRTPRGRAAAVFLAALLGAALAPACGPKGARGTGGKEALVVTRRLDGEPKTLNPILSTSNGEAEVLALVTRPLLDYDASLALVPGLAEAVEADAAHLVYTVRLEAGALWEDGSPVTADDVKTTLEAIVDPKTPALSRKAFFDGLEKVDVVDARTARVTFKTASANRLDAFNVPLIPASAYRGKDVVENPRNRNPLANGPFRLAKWTAGQSLELVRNTQFSGEPAAAERVVFRVVPDSASAFQGLLTGALDETRLNAQQQKALAAASAGPGARAHAIAWEDLAYTYVGWNNRSPLFSDARVRVALTMLVDREAIARTLYAGFARPANGPVPPGLWSHDATLEPWPHDPVAARERLKAAGFAPGPDGVLRRGATRFAFPLLLGAGSDLQRQIAEAIQQSYRQAGIEMSIQPLEWGAFIEKVDAGDFDACFLGMSLDPNPDLAPNWHSSQVPPNGLNGVWYGNAEADRLMDELRGTFDRAKAKELYGRLQRVIHEDEPVTFLHWVKVRWGLSNRLENVKTSPIGLSYFWPGAAAWRPRGPSAM